MTCTSSDGEAIARLAATVRHIVGGGAKRHAPSGSLILILNTRAHMQEQRKNRVCRGARFKLCATSEWYSQALT